MILPPQAIHLCSNYDDGKMEEAWTDSNCHVLLYIRVIPLYVLIREKETWFDSSKLTIGEVTMLSFLVCPRLVPVTKHNVWHYSITDEF
jgi:hypothetical protein